MVLEGREDLPWRAQVELAVLLRELERLADDSTHLIVVAHLDEAGEWEILAERMAGEAVVGEDATQVRVVGEEHAVHVPDLALEPVGALEQAAYGVDGRQLVRVGLDAHTLVVAHRQQVVDDLEAEDARRHVHGGHVDERVKLRAMVALEEAQHGHHAVRMDEQLELVAAVYLRTLHKLGQALRNVFADLDQLALLRLVGLLYRGCVRTTTTTNKIASAVQLKCIFAFEKRSKSI